MGAGTRVAMVRGEYAPCTDTKANADPRQIVRSALALMSCTGTERHDDPHQTAHMSPTCPSASADPSILGREPSSAPHVEPTAGISGSSTSIGSVAGSLVEQAVHSRSVVAHTFVSST
jgi:hypothetical protein